jgi:carboxylesterase type B
MRWLGAISVGIQLLNSGLEKLVWAAVSFLPMDYSITFSCRTPYFALQILESGSAGTLPLFKPDRNQGIWEKFVAAVPACAALAKSNDTFDCLRSVNASVILDASSAATSGSLQQYLWVPLLDGQLVPGLPSNVQKKGQFARLPVITGTNLDEGKKV